MKSSHYVLIFLFFCMEYFGHAQYLHKMMGKVLDIHTKQPIQASIDFTCLTNDGYLGFIENDKNCGSYELDLLTNQKYILKISSPNYISITDTISVNKMIQKTYSLNPLYPFEILTFHTGKFKLENINNISLQKTIQIMNQFPNFKVQLEGHSDYIGNKKLNMKLSKHRAETIKQYLIDAGITARRIKIKAFGGSAPLIQSHDHQKRNVNQRVEVRFLK